MRRSGCASTSWVRAIKIVDVKTRRSETLQIRVKIRDVVEVFDILCFKETLSGYGASVCFKREGTRCTIVRWKEGDSCQIKETLKRFYCDALVQDNESPRLVRMRRCAVTVALMRVRENFHRFSCLQTRCDSAAEQDVSQ
jgi:hypothetical protein